MFLFLAIVGTQAQMHSQSRMSRGREGEEEWKIWCVKREGLRGFKNEPFASHSLTNNYWLILAEGAAMRVVGEGGGRV